MTRFHHRSNFCLICKLSITKLQTGKLSSILVSKVIKISMLPVTFSTRNSDLFLIKFMFKWAKTNLFKLSLLIDFKSLTQSPDFSLSKDVSRVPSTIKIPEIFRLFCQLTILHISLVNILPNIRESFLFKYSLFLMRF